MPVDQWPEVDAKRAIVTYDAAKVTPQEMVDAVNELGCQASLAARGSSAEPA